MLRDPALIPLSHHHQHALATCVMTRRALAQAPSPAVIAQLAARIVTQFDLELVNHFEVEERDLFPLCAGLPLVEQLVAEHRTLERLVDPLRSAPTQSGIESFCELLTAHIRREENELFQQIQQTLPRDVLARAGEAIAAHAVKVCL